MILDKVARVAILAPGSQGTDKEGYLTHSGFLYGGVRAAAVRVNIQPAGAELTALTEGQLYKTYKAFTRASGVVETMRLTVSGTNDIFIVRGREKYDYGVERHYELVLSKEGR